MPPTLSAPNGDAGARAAAASPSASDRVVAASAS